MNYLVQGKDYLVKGMQLIELGTGIANTLGFSNSIPKSSDSPLNKKVQLNPELAIFSLVALYLSPEGSKIRIEKSHIEIDVTWMQTKTRPPGCIHHLRDILKSVRRFCAIEQKTESKQKIDDRILAAKAACKALKSLRKLYREKIQAVNETEGKTYRKYCKKIKETRNRLQLFIQPKTNDDLEKIEENLNVEKIDPNSFGPIVRVDNLIEKHEEEFMMQTLKEGMHQKKKCKNYIESGEKLKKVLDLINAKYDNLVK